jgi:hypothetical protein
MQTAKDAEEFELKVDKFKKKSHIIRSSVI